MVITPSGKEFITPVTLSALTHKPVVSEFFSQKDGTWNSHVDLGTVGRCDAYRSGYGFDDRKDGERGG